MFEKLTSPEQIFNAKLGAALTMEQKLLDALEELEEHAQREEIKRALREHREQTRRHVANVEEVFRMLGEEIEDSPSPVVEALAKDGRSTIKKTDDSLVDVVVLSAAAESEHHEIAVYETLITNAEARGATQVVALLRQNLQDEQQALQVASTAMKAIAAEGIAVGAS